MWAMPTHGALLLGECAKIGYKPQWGTSSTLSDGVAMMQITKGLWEGMIHSNFGDAPDSNNPLMVKYRAWHQKYEPKERWSTFYIAGIVFAEPFVEGLRRTGKKPREKKGGERKKQRGGATAGSARRSPLRGKGNGRLKG